jgi:hypothetical protein
MAAKRSKLHSKEIPKDGEPKIIKLTQTAQELL